MNHHDRRAEVIALTMAVVGLGWLLSTSGGDGPPGIAQTAPAQEADRSATVLPTSRPGTPPCSVTAPPRFAARVAIEEAAAGEDETFDQWVERLVDLGEQTWLAFEDGDEVLAAESDQEARAELHTLRDSIPHTGGRGLQAMFGLDAVDVTIRGRVRRTVLSTLVEREQREYWQGVEYGASRESNDRFATAILSAIPGDASLAESLSGILIDQPFLGAAHESAVLGIVEQSTTEPFLVEPAEGLLRTLWHNLEATGARSSTSLASLAMLMLESDNSSERRAAISQLLRTADSHYESVVLEFLLRAHDSELARHAATVAAVELEPSRALSIVIRLAEVIGTDVRALGLTGPLMTLADRAPELLRVAYEERLADGVAPDVRAALVAGAGFRAADVELAQLAFDHDPVADVRQRALFVLSATASPAVAEAAMLRALDDDRFVDSPGRIGAVISALSNLATAGETDIVDRVGRRIRSHPMSANWNLRELDQLLARYIPDRGYAPGAR